MKWVWVRLDVLTAIHREQLCEHGGADGVRDHGLLESALARPENIAAYGEPAVFELGASYAYGIIRNHPFIDGNKRTGFIAAIMFLELNGQGFSATEAEAVEKTLAAAAGVLSEKDFALWLEANCKAL